MNRHRLLAAALLAAGVLAAADHAVVSASATDPLGCATGLFDPGGLLDEPEDVTAAAELAAATLGADVRVRAERSVDGGLDARVDQLVRQCDGWAAADGELDDHMVIVLFSVDEREASVYYGADLGPRLEDRWSDAIDAMTAEFPDDYDAGVIAALRELRSTSPSPVSSSTSAASSASAGGSGAGPVIGLLVIGALVLGGWLYRALSADGTGSWGDDGTGWSSGASRRRRSSFGGFSSRSRSRSRSSGSRRSSSGGSRRAGGGTKKW